PVAVASAVARVTKARVSKAVPHAAGSTASQATTAGPGAALTAAGNPDGHAAVPAAGQAVATSQPDHVIGDGTPASCTSAAVVAAVAEGGIITFNCGKNAVTILMTKAAVL